MDSNRESIVSADVPIDSRNLVETNIRLLGDQTTIGQVVQLLAYIRYAIQNNMKTEIKVKIGQYVNSTPFALDVNGQELKNLIAQSEININ